MKTVVPHFDEHEQQVAHTFVPAGRVGVVHQGKSSLFVLMLGYSIRAHTLEKGLYLPVFPF
jgi:hypothetical protein